MSEMSFSVTNMTSGFQNVFRSNREAGRAAGAAQNGMATQKTSITENKVLRSPEDVFKMLDGGESAESAGKTNPVKNNTLENATSGNIMNKRFDILA